MNARPLRDVVMRPITTIDPRRRPDEEFVYIDIRSVDNKRKVIASASSFRGREMPTRARQVVKTGDVLVATTRPYLNAVAQVTPAFDGQVCSTAFCVLRPGELLDTDYLFRWVQHPTFVGGLVKLLQGAMYPAVTDDDVLEQSILLPGRAQQRRVADHLTLQANGVEHISQALSITSARLLEFRRSILRNFYDGLTATRVPLRSIVRASSDIADGPFGSHLKTSHYQSSGVRVIRLGNVGLGRFIDADRAFVAPEHAATLQRHRVEGGDVVVAALGDGARPAGRACLVPEGLGQAIVKADCFRVRAANSGLDAAFLVHVMNCPQILDVIEAQSRGATRPRMTLGILKELEVPLPSLADQVRLVADVDKRLAAVDGADVSIRTGQDSVAALPAALLRRAFKDLSA